MSINRVHIYLFIFIYIISSSGLKAQVEKLYPLGENPILRQKAKEEKERSSALKTFHKTYFLVDTLNLPFLDDFSSDKLGHYDLTKYPASSMTQYTFYNFKKNGVLTDSTYYSPDTTYWQQYDTNLHQKVFIPKQSFTLDFYSYPGFGPPFTTSDSIRTAWPEYYEVNFDTITGNRIDSVLALLPILRLDTFIVDAYKMDAMGALWLEADVYLNNDFPVDPITVGVATFDGLDSAGRAIQFVPADSYGTADYLTSKPINLHTSNGAADSVYLSFYYEAQGRGNFPQTKDSLILEFRSPIYNTWDIVWTKEGPNTDISSSCSFSFVNIPIRDTNYLQNGFQFRFRNKATFSGNLDHWHLDYVKLDKLRFNNDKTSTDIAFINDQETLLSGVYATTWKQYSPSMMLATMSNKVVNLDENTANTQIFYQVEDNYGNLIYQSTPTSDNLGTGINNCEIISACPEFKNPSVHFSYPDSDLCKTYIVKHVVRTSPDAIRTNDTIRFVQHISNYIAYDDGTAENGWGLNIANGQAAYKFILNSSDVITGVRIYFNPLINDISSKEFYIKIWNDAGGKPGSVIYTSAQTYSPVYSYVHNGFVEYPIDPTTIDAGTFYIGWEQLSGDVLNVGFDVNNNNYLNLFKYLPSTGWSNTIFDGTLMLRPVFGTCPFETIGFNESSLINNAARLFPNPANDKIYLQLGKDDYQKHEISIYDLSGRVVLNERKSSGESIDITSLSDGIYFTKIQLNNGEFENQKLIVER